MSRPIKEMIIEEYRRRFDGVDGGVVLDIRGIDAGENNSLRAGLREKDIRVTVVKNTLARQAFVETPLDGLDPALSGPSALAYSGESVVNVARAVLDWARKIDQLEVKGAVLDGTYFEGEAGVKRLSDFPTREEAQAKVVQILLSPARNVVGAATSPGSRVLGIVKEIEERLERGEAIGA
mgnify:CR=1 FL=1